MNNYYPLILTTISGFSALIGLVFLYIKVRKVGEVITYFLSISFTIMLSISIFELVPRGLNYLILNYNDILGLILAFLSIMLGNISIYLINSKFALNDSSTLYKIGVLSFIAIILHNIPEGIIVYMGSISNYSLGIKLCIAIILHNIPEGIAICIPLRFSNTKKSLIYKIMIISALSEPLGGLVGYLLLHNIMNDTILSMILLFVAGLMISLCVSKIIPESKLYNKKKYFILGIISGLVI